MAGTKVAEGRAETVDADGTVRAVRDGVADAVGAIQAKAGDMGERLPEVVDAVRDGANQGARTFQAWPEATQRLATAFAVGIGVGLMVAGAPRLVVTATMLPIVVMAATSLGRPGPDRKRPS
jgi:hypothetical protein